MQMFYLWKLFILLDRMQYVWKFLQNSQDINKMSHPVSFTMAGSWQWCFPGYWIRAFYKFYMIDNVNDMYFLIQPATYLLHSVWYFLKIKKISYWPFIPAALHCNQRATALLKFSESLLSETVETLTAPLCIFLDEN